jgi:hypothetical protein
MKTHKGRPRPDPGCSATDDDEGGRSNRRLEKNCITRSSIICNLQGR